MSAPLRRIRIPGAKPLVMMDAPKRGEARTAANRVYWQTQAHKARSRPYARAIRRWLRLMGLA